MPTLQQATFISGKFGYVLHVASNTWLPFSRWKVPLRGNYLPRNNFNRFPQGVIGIVGGEITIGGFIDVAANHNYAQAPFSIRLNDTEHSIVFGWSSTFFLPAMRVKFAGVDYSNDADQGDALEYTGQLQGFTNEADPHFYPGDTAL